MGAGGWGVGSSPGREKSMSKGTVQKKACPDVARVQTLKRKEA